MSYLSLYFVSISFLFVSTAQCQSSGVQPYIDQMQKEEALGERDGTSGSGSHIDKLLKKADEKNINKDVPGSQPYIEALKRSGKDSKTESSEADGYSQRL